MRKEPGRELYQMTSNDNLYPPLRLNIPRHDSPDLLLLPSAPLLNGVCILQEDKKRSVQRAPQPGWEEQEFSLQSNRTASVTDPADEMGTRVKRSVFL